MCLDATPPGLLADSPHDGRSHESLGAIGTEFGTRARGSRHGSAQRSEQADGGGLTVWPVAAAWPWPWAFVRATVREHVRRSVRAVGTGRAAAGPEGVGRIGAPSHETSAGLRQHSAAA
eukprot:COSAG02_NODE_4760_length_5017_cov_7.215331_4_plen_119_part_00